MINPFKKPQPQPQPNYDYYYHSFLETFAQQQYEWLADKSKGLIVYDLGAQSGDSALYLLQHGAKAIIAYEPDPQAYSELIKNVKDINAFNLKAPEPFKPINSEPYAIKCDVEGAEHKIFTKEADLDNCKALQIEYHFSPKKLPEILKEKGFKVKVEKLWATNKECGEVGWIYAWR